MQRPSCKRIHAFYSQRPFTLLFDEGGTEQKNPNILRGLTVLYIAVTLLKDNKLNRRKGNKKLL